MNDLVLVSQKKGTRHRKREWGEDNETRTLWKTMPPGAQPEKELQSTCHCSSLLLPNLSQTRPHPLQLAPYLLPKDSSEWTPPTPFPPSNTNPFHLSRKERPPTGTIPHVDKQIQRTEIQIFWGLFFSHLTMTARQINDHDFLPKRKKLKTFTDQTQHRKSALCSVLQVSMDN